MHELTVTESILDMALEEAKKAGAISVDKISIVLGDLTGIAEDCVRFYFDIIKDGTMAQNAELDFTHVPAQFRCPHCGHVFERDRLAFTCPNCGSPGVLMDKGNELYIDHIEVSFDGDKTGKEYSGCERQAG
jgi:hydrogenase nickel incorporation protein HypA/HybF